MKHQTLFSPTKIKHLEIRNRFVRSATHVGTSFKNGYPYSNIEKIYEDLAKGGIGLIITGQAIVRDCISDMNVDILPYSCIDDDCYIVPWTNIINKVHNEGSKIAMQISHLGIQGKLDLLKPEGPSKVTFRTDKIIPKQLNIKEVKLLENKFAEASLRAKKAGFDAVQIHCAHGYLISNFLSPYTNVRNDEYGGSTKNRAKFAVEIIKKTKKLVGRNYPIIIKLNFCDVPGGLTFKESLTIAKLCINAGVDCIEVSGGVVGDGKAILTQKVTEEKDEAYFLEFSQKLKKYTDIPIILVGGLRSLNVIKNIINEKQADLVSMSRPLLCEPNLINRWKNGDMQKAKCTSCNACLNLLGKNKDAYCVPFSK